MSNAIEKEATQKQTLFEKDVFNIFVPPSEVVEVHVLSLSSSMNPEPGLINASMTAASERILNLSEKNLKMNMAWV